MVKAPIRVINPLTSPKNRLSRAAPNLGRNRARNRLYRAAASLGRSWSDRAGRCRREVIPCVWIYDADLLSLSLVNGLIGSVVLISSSENIYAIIIMRSRMTKHMYVLFPNDIPGVNQTTANDIYLTFCARHAGPPRPSISAWSIQIAQVVDQSIWARRSQAHLQYHL